MSLAWLFSYLVLLIVIYLWRLNALLTLFADDARSLSPERLTPEVIKEAARRERSNPTDIRPHIPPKTSHRYIVVGGAGFLGGYIVLQLLARGESPRNIRVLDIRLPTRKDLLTGLALLVDFRVVDISNREAVFAAFSDPWSDNSLEPLTVIHTASNIRFYERHPKFLPLSHSVNLHGTQYLLDASIHHHAKTFIYTSSGALLIRRQRFWLSPLQLLHKQPAGLLQIFDDDTPPPRKHDEYFCNYVVSKHAAEQAVCAAHSDDGMRTACIRPGNGIFGTGDHLTAFALPRGGVPTWVPNVLQSYVYVENCALAHLQLERALLENKPECGGHHFTVSDPNPPLTFGDVHKTLQTLEPSTSFPYVPIVLIMLLSEIFGAYHHLVHHLPFLPPLSGDLINIQPPIFDITSIHLVFRDERARDMWGYISPFTTLEGMCKCVREYQESKEGKKKEGCELESADLDSERTIQRGAATIRVPAPPLWC